MFFHLNATNDITFMKKVMFKEILKLLKSEDCNVIVFTDEKIVETIKSDRTLLKYFSIVFFGLLL